MHPYDIVASLEQRVAEYAGAPYAVAVDSCTNALLLSLKYYFDLTGRNTVELPAYTYVGVAYAVLNAGGKCVFRDYDWQGAYRIGHTPIIDSARRFRRNMYVDGTFFCLSCHWGKHLKIGRGGFILTGDAAAAEALRIMRFDGRTARVAPRDDKFVLPGFHCYMLPEEAARGLVLMNYMPDDNADLPWDDYADLRNYPIFTRGR
ncbi:MAG TPA: DegT/DnrJ/EryC1/StrS family aminotransferase [Dissulfurispiraceae bacterium]|nr:DegT/DnrJ/EryC1/StrS family aminotransferase [Dissulfurispiraceae bacterium]